GWGGPKRGSARVPALRASSTCPAAFPSTSSSRPSPSQSRTLGHALAPTLSGAPYSCNRAGGSTTGTPSAVRRARRSAHIAILGTNQEISPLGARPANHGERVHARGQHELIRQPLDRWIVDRRRWRRAGCAVDQGHRRTGTAYRRSRRETRRAIRPRPAHVAEVPEAIQKVTHHQIKANGWLGRRDNCRAS